MSTTFRSFRLLPPEIRLKIWQEALPGPRTIHLVEDFELDSGRFVQRSSHCRATTSCPKAINSLLQVCGESRTVVLKRYEALFAPRCVEDRSFSLHYFDPSRDGIFVAYIWPWVRGGSSRPTGLYQTRRLCISCNAWWLMWRFDLLRDSLLGIGGLLKFRHLEELNIVFRILTDHERERIRQYKGPMDMSSFFRGPHDIEFAIPSVDIQVEPILEKFALMKAGYPEWKVPRVKLVAWGARPEAGPID